MVLVTHELAFARQVADEWCSWTAASWWNGAPSEVLRDPREERTQRFLHRLLDR